MQQSITSKQEWMQYIQKTLTSGQTFHFKTTFGNKLLVLFAADTFRRNGYEVRVEIIPTEIQTSSLLILIFPRKNTKEFTLRHNDDPSDIITQIKDSKCTIVSLRACGTTVALLFQILDTKLHSGWYIDNTIMNTLTQQKDTYKKRNTVLHVVIRKG